MPFLKANKWYIYICGHGWISNTSFSLQTSTPMSLFFVCTIPTNIEHTYDSLWSLWLWLSEFRFFSPQKVLLWSELSLAVYICTFETKRTKTLFEISFDIFARLLFRLSFRRSLLRSSRHFYTMFPHSLTLTHIHPLFMCLSMTISPFLFRPNFSSEGECIFSTKMRVDKRKLTTKEHFIRSLSLVLVFPITVFFKFSSRTKSVFY